LLSSGIELRKSGCRAVAIALSVGLQQGLEAIDALAASGELDKYYLFHAARADILFRMNHLEEADAAYRNASALAGNRIEQDFLARRLAAVAASMGRRAS
jgi:RNA polymerase sigma-70 factor, ECF subfamily